MLSTVLNIIIFEDCRNQWSMSRPLLGLILLNEKVNVPSSRRSLRSCLGLSDVGAFSLKGAEQCQSRWLGSRDLERSYVEERVSSPPLPQPWRSGILLTFIQKGTRSHLKNHNAFPPSSREPVVHALSQSQGGYSSDN